MATANVQRIITPMEVLLGYLLGIGTVVAIARRGDTARNAVAWTARHVGALSGKVSTALEHTARVARQEFEKGRVEDLHGPLSESLGGAVEATNGVSNSTGQRHLNGA